jgi:hypothetical protein
MTLILVNAVLGAVVVYGLVAFLVSAIHTDRVVQRVQVRRLPERRRDQLAA